MCQYGYKNNVVSIADFGPLFASNAVAALTRRVGVNGIMDMHLSSSLKLMQIVGNVNPLDRGPQGLAAKSHSAFLHSNDAVEMGMVERGQAIAVSFDVQAPIKDTYVYFQVILQCNLVVLMFNSSVALMLGTVPGAT